MMAPAVPSTRSARPSKIRRHRAWLRRADGRLALITVSAAPLHDAAGAGRRCARHRRRHDRQRRTGLPDRRPVAAGTTAPPHHFAGRPGNRHRRHDGHRALGTDPCPGRRGCGGDRQRCPRKPRSTCCMNAGPARPRCWKPPLPWLAAAGRRTGPRHQPRTDARCWRSGARPVSAPMPAWRSGAAPTRVRGTGRTPLLVGVGRPYRAHDPGV